MIATSGLLAFQKGGFRHLVPVPAASIGDVQAWRDKLQPYSWANITNWYFIQTDAFEDVTITPTETTFVEFYLRASFFTEDYEQRLIKIPAPKSELFEDQEDRGNRVTDATGAALADMYQQLTGETVTFSEGALYSSAPSKGGAFEE